MNVRVLIGSKKGAFVLESDSERRNWRVRGPLCEHWPLTHVAADLADGTIYATGGNAWFGPAVWKSNDGGTTWTHSSQGVGLPPRRDVPVQCAWVAHAAHGRLYVGVEPAGLFVSGDGGERFREVEGLRRHPSRPQWQPGGIGLVLHSIVSDPTDVRRLWVGISSVGVFYTEDGGETWSPRNSGTRCDFLPEGERYPEFGQCVHNLTLAPGCTDRLYQQNHCGMYRKRRRRRVLAQHRERPPVELMAFLLPPIPVTPTRCSCCRSTVTPRAAIRRTQAWPSGARAMAARIGLTVVRDCLSPAHISV